MKNYTLEIKTVDTHTMGEATRIVTGGFPSITGDTMMEKKDFVRTHYDHIRQLLMNEPRGHKDMFGSILVEPTNPIADIGVIFMDSGDYLNMCGHGTIGTVTMCITKGLIAKKELVYVDTPSGLIECHVDYEEEYVKSVSFINVPSFSFIKNYELQVDQHLIQVDVAFGGSFFGIVKSSQLNLKIELKNKDKFMYYAHKIRNILNDELSMVHPEKPTITTVDLIEFTEEIGGNHYRNVVVFGDNQIDRSPCGTGTCAKLSTLDLSIGDHIIQESIIGSRFSGEIIGKTTVGKYPAIIPKITGAAWITGEHNFVLQAHDVYTTGFSV